MPINPQTLALLEKQAKENDLQKLKKLQKTRKLIIDGKEWQYIQKLGPGVRTYKGLTTLFYNGEILFDNGLKVYTLQQRQSLQQIIILPNVKVISEYTFANCDNVQRIIMCDTVERIEWRAFDKCTSLVFVKLSRYLKFIDGYVFQNCTFLEAMYIPQSCMEVHTQAFYNCKRLKVLIASRDAVLGDGIVRGTALIEASPFEKIAFGEYDSRITTHEQVNEWIRNLNHEEIYTLHVLCSAEDVSLEAIVEYIQEHGISAMNRENSIGCTPSQYLASNPYTDIREHKIINSYILKQIGEIQSNE